MAKIQHYRQLGSNPAPNALLYGELAVAKDGSLFVGNEAGVPIGVAGQKLFDQVIRTQAEFEALIASPTWLNAVSVCFVGNGGTLKFTRSDGQGCKIPQTVKQIQGMNAATIEVTDFFYNSTTNQAALWYETRPETADYWMDGMSVACMSGSGFARAFYQCTSLSNCAGTAEGNSAAYDGSIAFYKCTSLSNCTGTNEGESATVRYGFKSCTKLVNCTGVAKTTSIIEKSIISSCYGFASCTQLSNCTSTGIDASGNSSGHGFNSCTHLSNCTGAGTTTVTGGYTGGSSSGYGFSNCTHLSNCTGTGTTTGADSGRGGNSSGYGFNNCTHLSNCTGTGTTTVTDSGKGGNSSGHGFVNCTELSNCTGTGTGKSPNYSGYSFYSCSYLNGCKQGATASTTGFLGGTNTRVDTNTVAATASTGSGDQPDSP